MAHAALGPEVARRMIDVMIAVTTLAAESAFALQVKAAGNVRTRLLRDDHDMKEGNSAPACDLDLQWQSIGQQMQIKR